MSRRVKSLLSVKKLRKKHDEVTVLDVRWKLSGPSGVEEFERGHVPGAAYVDLETDLAGPPGAAGRHPLPDPATFVEAMRRCGVRNDRRVVVYDDWSGLAAARAWWLLRHHGHRDVRVLDGGWAAWRDGGGAVARGRSSVEPGDFHGEPGSMRVADPLSVRGFSVLLDARAPERYTGEDEPVDPVAGHIPGAINVPATANLTEDGRFREREELAALYGAVGARPDVDVAAYCGSGVTAAHGVLAMELAGVRAALYPGSWSEWVSDPARPVATGVNAGR